MVDFPEGDNKDSALKAFIVGDDKKLSEPVVRVLLELLKHKDPLFKSELTEAEIAPFTRAKSFTDIMSLPLYDSVIETFLRANVSKRRRRVKEIIEAINPNAKVQQKGFFSRLFGGRDE